MAALIFSVAVAGVFASLGNIRKAVVTDDKSLQATYCGQQVLETLRARVDNRDWADASSSLALTLPGNNHTIDAASSPPISSFTACANSPVTSISYTVSDAGNGTRKVTATVNWP